jgi:hypothetical protein
MAHRNDPTKTLADCLAKVHKLILSKLYPIHLKSCRLTCKEVNELAIAQLFSKVYVAAKLISVNNFLKFTPFKPCLSCADSRVSFASIARPI